MNRYALESFTERVRAALDVLGPVRFCELLGIASGAKRQAHGLIVLCPWHDERNPSCSVHNKQAPSVLAKCPACDHGGGVLDLIAAVHRLSLPADIGRVVDIGAAMVGLSRDDHADAGAPARPRPDLRPVPLPKPIADLTAEWDALPPVDADCWDYLRGRGLELAADWCRSVTPQLAGELGNLAGRGYLLAQALRDGKGRVVAIQVRRIVDPPPTPDDDGKDRRFRLHGHAAAGVFGQVDAIGGARYIVLAEGFADTLAGLIACDGRPNVAVVGVPGISNDAAALQLPLRDKRVLVAYDADERSDAAASKLMKALQEKGARPIRARPTSGKDLADMLRAGVDLREFFRSSLTGFQSVASTIGLERAERLANGVRTCRWGIRFIDHAMGKILCDDIILLGAYLGSGKTELALSIARANVQDGKVVHYIALEAGRRELERRLKFPLISRKVWEDRERNNHLWRHLDMLRWLEGDPQLDRALDRYERAAEEQLVRELSNLRIRYKGATAFDAATLAQAMRDATEDGTDLIIVDHLHYVDLPDAMPETRAMSRLLTTIRDTQHTIQRPVLLVGHIRKAERNVKSPPLVPNAEEFHGSSNIPKIATRAVMFARAWNQEPTQSHFAPTYISPVKLRFDSGRIEYCGLLDFNRRTGRYEAEYELGQLVAGRSKFVFVANDKLPRWAADRQVDLFQEGER